MNSMSTANLDSKQHQKKQRCWLTFLIKFIKMKPCWLVTHVTSKEGILRKSNSLLETKLANCRILVLYVMRSKGCLRQFVAKSYNKYWKGWWSFLMVCLITIFWKDCIHRKQINVCRFGKVLRLSSSFALWDYRNKAKIRYLLTKQLSKDVGILTAYVVVKRTLSKTSCVTFQNSWLTWL